MNKETAFQAYYEDMGYEEIPEAFQNYIDWNKIICDHENNGLTITNCGPVPGKTFIDRFLFVKEY